MPHLCGSIKKDISTVYRRGLLTDQARFCANLQKVTYQIQREREREREGGGREGETDRQTDTERGKS